MSQVPAKTVAFAQLCEKLRAEVKEVDVHQAKKMLDDKQKCVMIDVREDREWLNGHIKGALHIGKGVIERDIEEFQFPSDFKLLLYCGGGFRSLIAAKNLMDMGFENVYSVDGGWRDWMASKYPVSSGDQ